MTTTLPSSRQSPPNDCHARRVRQFVRIELRPDEVAILPADRRRRPLARHELSPPQCVPFLRWAGGKQWLARAMPVFTPSSYERYFEPFLGGGSIYFSLQPATAYLTDVNSELIRTFRAIRDQPQRVIANLRRWKYDRQVFEAVRRLQTRSEPSSAARFIYLNRTAFNGIYRVNRQGQFNVPFGDFANPQICNTQRIDTCSSALNKAKVIDALDFEKAVLTATRDDFVYFDPPYITGHNNNGFVKWNSKLFSWADQERLASLAKQLAHRGVHVLVSNADHPAVTELYDGFHRYRLERASQIGGLPSRRRRVTEVLASSYPIRGINASD